MKYLFILMMGFFLASCVSKPPRDVDNICSIFRQYPRWYAAAKDVERRWRVPVPVQMAIIHQESKFDGHARPPRGKLLGFLPMHRPSTAYGYAQALTSTWAIYRKSHGNLFSSRDNFAEGVNFIGWYANAARVRAGILPSDAYTLYLAYHEGVGGFQRKTYLKKPWLIQVARKVKAKTALYRNQLATCGKGNYH
jgi:hypothetical protein